MMMMLRYHLHSFAQRYKLWRDGRRASARMDELLRRNRFLQIAPARWEQQN